MIDLAPQHLQIVKDILKAHVPQAVIFVFGSRAKGLAKKTSDLDLAINNVSPLGISLSNLPMRVDVVDLNAVSNEFKELIEKSSQPLSIWEKTP